MPLDEKYVTGISLDEVFIDKDTGEPMAQGTIEFFEDDNRNSKKEVYELTGSPPNYTYSPLPNPITLGSNGTPQNASNNNVTVYYKPYDDNDDLQLYYVQVKNKDDVEQFTREAWPNIPSTQSATSSPNSVTNALSNPQFAQVLFDTENTYTISGSGSEKTVKIAPDWDLVIGFSGSGNLNVSRTENKGSQSIATNPPYTLNFSSLSNINSLKLRQRLSRDTNVFAARIAQERGYIASAILINDNTNITMSYEPSNGTAETILTANNVSGSPAQFTNTYQLDAANNSDLADDSYIDIVIDLPTSGSFGLSSVQVVGLETNEQNVLYDQMPVNRQVDQLFHYYKPLLEQKRLPSFLTGWDFPMNPAQWGEVYSAANSADESAYVWDQTIIFQSAASGFSVSRASSNAIKITAQDTGKVAIIQYLDKEESRKVLNDRFAINIAGSTTKSGGISGTVSIYYTDDVSLPDMGTQTSIVGTLDANGKPNSTNGAWNEVPRSDLGDARFTLSSSSTTNYNDLHFNGWDLEGDSDVNTANFLAVVIGFEEFESGDDIELDSISLCSGDIATRPAPLSLSETRLKCERFYEKSYGEGDVAGDATDDNACVRSQNSYNARIITGSGDPNYRMVASGFDIRFRSEKASSSTSVTLYAPDGTVDRVQGNVWGAGTGTAGTANINVNKWDELVDSESATYQPNSYFEGVTEGGTSAGKWCSGWIEFHYIADARLGVA